MKKQKPYVKNKGVLVRKRKKEEAKVTQGVAKKMKRTEETLRTKFSDWAFGNEFSNLFYPSDTVNNRVFTINQFNLAGQALNLIRYGNTIYQKIGNKVKMNSIDLNLFWIANETIQIERDVQYRLVLLYYKFDHLAAYPTAQETFVTIWNNGTVRNGTIGDNIAPDLVNNVEVLFDEIYWFSALSTLGALTSNGCYGRTDKANFNVRLNIPLGGREVVYDQIDGGTVGQLPDIKRGALVLYVLSNDDTLPNKYGITGSTRLWWNETQR